MRNKYSESQNLTFLKTSDGKLLDLQEELDKRKQGARKKSVKKIPRKADSIIVSSPPLKMEIVKINKWLPKSRRIVT